MVFAKELTFVTKKLVTKEIKKVEETKIINETSNEVVYEKDNKTENDKTKIELSIDLSTDEGY
ncbi:MAG: hypothetical protein ACRYE7_01870 [Janthinobacterium lividum]